MIHLNCSQRESELCCFTFAVWLQLDVREPHRLQQGPGEEWH